MKKDDILFWLIIILIILKLFGVVNISWVLLTSVFWIPWTILFILALFIGLSVIFFVIRFFML